MAAVTLLATVGASSASRASTIPGGNVTFAPYDQVVLGTNASSVAIGDFTGDGRGDIALSTVFFGNPPVDNKLFLFAQQPDGSLGTPSVLATHIGIAGSTGLTAARLDGGTSTDAVLGIDTGADVFYQRHGTLQPAVHVWSPGGAGDVLALDLVGGARTDLLMGSGYGIFVLRNLGGGRWRRTKIWPDAVGSIAADDVTGDGLPDVIFYRGHHLYVLAQRSGGSFVKVARYLPALGQRRLGWDVAVGDVNGDGRNDVLLTLNENHPHSRLEVFAGRADGTLDPPVTMPSYDSPEPITVADMNGDGLMDVVVLHGGSMRAGVYLQQDDGALAPEQLFPIPNTSHYMAEGLAVGDVNGDGKPDIAIADFSGLVILRQT